MKGEIYPWDETHPFRPTKTVELRGHLLDDFTRKRAMKINREPVFRRSEKYYDLIKVLKSQTSVSHWLIKMAGQYFVVLQANSYRFDETCQIFLSDRRGIYNNLMPIAIYRGFVDIEAAADRFSQEYMAMLIDERDPRLTKFFAEHEIDM